jgi:hypothetical protein
MYITTPATTFDYNLYNYSGGCVFMYLNSVSRYRVISGMTGIHTVGISRHDGKIWFKWDGTEYDSGYTSGQAAYDIPQGTYIYLGVDGTGGAVDYMDWQLTIGSNIMIKYQFAYNIPGTNSTIYDLSGNLNHATILGDTSKVIYQLNDTYRHWEYISGFNEYYNTAGNTKPLQIPLVLNETNITTPSGYNSKVERHSLGYCLVELSSITVNGQDITKRDNSNVWTELTIYNSNNYLWPSWELDNRFICQNINRNFLNYLFIDNNYTNSNGTTSSKLYVFGIQKNNVIADKIYDAI